MNAAGDVIQVLAWPRSEGGTVGWRFDWENEQYFSLTVSEKRHDADAVMRGFCGLGGHNHKLEISIVMAFAYSTVR